MPGAVYWMFRSTLRSKAKSFDLDQTCKNKGSADKISGIDGENLRPDTIFQ